MALLPVAAKTYKYLSVPNDPMHARIYTLENGLKVYLSVNKEQPRVTAHIAVNTGHRNDPADCTGLAHYLEHLMFKGTDKFGTTDYAAEKPYLDKITALYEEYRKLTNPMERKAKYHQIDSISQIAAQYNIPNEYDKAMSAMGGLGSNAYTWFDITCYTEDVPNNELERWAILQSDRFQNLVTRGFHTELEAVYEEKNMSMTDDSNKMGDALLAKLFPSHSYGTQTTIGTQDHLKNPSLVEIKKYYDRYYKPNNIAICMAGDLDYDRTMEIIEKYFGNWKAGKDCSPRQFPKQPVFTTPQDTTVVGLEKEQISLGWRFEGASSLQCDTLCIIDAVLSNGRCGLIDLDINQKMLTQEASSGVLNLKDYSVLTLDGTPKDGQSLDDVKALLLAEVQKLKSGDFDDDILVSYINNEKLRYMSSLDNNSSRVSVMVNAFINGESWQNQVSRIDRMSKITKSNIVDFANKYLTDGYVVAYKIKGEDTNIKKIEKPEITPIPSNRDYQSQFLCDLVSKKVDAIQPKFIDFEKDMAKGETKSKLPLLYVQNNDNDLFTLQYRYEFGDRADVRYSVLDGYTELLGTSKLSNEEIKKQFYKLACDYSVNVGNEVITITLSGLNENMISAMKLMEQIIQDTKSDKDVYNLYIENTLKSRDEEKKNQKSCYSYLVEYALHGSKNDYTNIMPEKDLRNTDPSVYTALLKGLSNYKHTILYYGPCTMTEISAAIEKNHKTAKRLLDVPHNREWNWTATSTPQVIIAPYEANNIYLRMFSNELKPLEYDKLPIIYLFNEYFGGGMNTVVFQELRETRGLAYSANALYSTPTRISEPMYWTENIITQNDKMIECINTFKDITDNMPQTTAAFDIAKENVIKSLSSTRTTKMDIIYSYLAAKKMGLDHTADEDIYNKIHSLKMDDILNFEKQYIRQKPLHYIILGNEKELDMKALENIAPIKRVTINEIFGE